MVSSAASPWRKSAASAPSPGRAGVGCGRRPPLAEVGGFGAFARPRGRRLDLAAEHLDPLAPREGALPAGLDGAGEDLGLPRLGEAGPAGIGQQPLGLAYVGGK